MTDVEKQNAQPDEKGRSFFTAKMGISILWYWMCVLIGFGVMATIKKEKITLTSALIACGISLACTIVVEIITGKEIRNRNQSLST
ncbi:hypothetical protein LSAT2_004072 [Lamellibrachia satsuma]|nr:hypothetical protein LSAT2_004072 [Lamellibrachia satsuma]